MKKNTTILLFFLAAACTQKPADTVENNSNENQQELVEETQVPTARIKTQVSTFDDVAQEEMAIDLQKKLAAMAKKNAFQAVHTKLMAKLSTAHQNYFKTNANYLVIAAQTGALFTDGSKDAAFAVYDKTNQRISFVLFQEKTNAYGELFRDWQVRNGLEDVDCSYGAAGTLDYQLAQEIVMAPEFIANYSDTFIEESPLKITNINKDEMFVIDQGCQETDLKLVTIKNTLAISTSGSYNNWECLRYDATNNTFVIFYGQAFAD